VRKSGLLKRDARRLSTGFMRLPTAASQRIHYPYSLYLVFWSCFLRRIKGVILPIKTFPWIVSSGSFFLNPVLPHYSRLRPIRRRFLVHFSCFSTSRSRSVKILLISVISGKILIYLITRLCQIRTRLRVHSPSLQISVNPFDQCYQR
jgi:hypothetical protein